MTFVDEDKYELENIAKDNQIRADLFIPFTITRLREVKTGVGEARLIVWLRNLRGAGENESYLCLTWTEESVHSGVLPVQERIVTEFAACGVACVLVPLYTSLQVLRVALVGDKFDYWVGNGEEELGLEISGTISTNLEWLHTEKTQQLLENPHCVGGYVAVTNFTTKNSIFSFQHYNEGNVMNPREKNSISRKSLNEEFAKGEEQVSGLIIEGYLLEQQERYEEAAEKYAQAAKLEEKLCTELSKKGLMDKYYSHLFSAASCWAQAGNIYRAIWVTNQLLQDSNIPGPLRKRIEEYQQMLRNRRKRWFTFLTQSSHLTTASDI